MCTCTKSQAQGRGEEREKKNHPVGYCILYTVFLGDEGFVKLVHKVVFGRTDESSPKERLSPLVPLGQEFHAEKVTTLHLVP